MEMRRFCSGRCGRILTRVASVNNLAMVVFGHHRPLCHRHLASFPGPRPASRRLQYGKAGLQATGSWAGGLGTRLTGIYTALIRQVPRNRGHCGKVDTVPRSSCPFTYMGGRSNAHAQSQIVYTRYTCKYTHTAPATKTSPYPFSAR